MDKMFELKSLMVDIAALSMLVISLIVMIVCINVPYIIICILGIALAIHASVRDYKLLKSEIRKDELTLSAYKHIINDRASGYVETLKERDEEIYG